MGTLISILSGSGVCGSASDSWRFILLCRLLRYFGSCSFFRFRLRKDSGFLQESRDGSFCLFIIAFDIAAAKDAEALPFVGKGRRPAYNEAFRYG
jgi:hypothetical protein